MPIHEWCGSRFFGERGNGRKEDSINPATADDGVQATAHHGVVSTLRISSMTSAGSNGLDMYF
jgi:hypothetical protein